jgi:hypothetical protein
VSLDTSHASLAAPSKTDMITSQTSPPSPNRARFWRTSASQVQTFKPPITLDVPVSTPLHSCVCQYCCGIRTPVSTKSNSIIRVGTNLYFLWDSWQGKLCKPGYPCSATATNRNLLSLDGLTCNANLYRAFIDQHHNATMFKPSTHFTDELSRVAKPPVSALLFSHSFFRKPANVMTARRRSGGVPIAATRESKPSSAEENAVTPASTRISSINVVPGRNVKPRQLTPSCWRRSAFVPLRFGVAPVRARVIGRSRLACGDVSPRRPEAVAFA